MDAKALHGRSFRWTCREVRADHPFRTGTGASRPARGHPQGGAAEAEPEHARTRDSGREIVGRHGRGRTGAEDVRLTASALRAGGPMIIPSSAGAAVSRSADMDAP
jgi:hypothetical protein